VAEELVVKGAFALEHRPLELPRGDVQKGQAPTIPGGDGRQVVGLPGEEAFLEEGSRGEELGHLPPDQPLRLLGGLHLVGHRQAEAHLEKPLGVGLKGP
jgi:hypothetical protein